MDVFIDILIPKTNPEVNELKEQYHYWGGEKIPFTPREFKWKNSLSLVLEDIPPPYQEIIPNYISIDAHYIYRLNDDAIYEWEKSINKKIRTNSSNALKEFILEYLARINSWGVVISFDEDIIDGIDEFALLKNEGELIQKMENSINWNNGRGFIGYKISSSN